MEAVKTTVDAIQNEQTKTLSRSQQNSIETGRSEKAISPTEHAALFTIINKSRLLNGWTTRTAKDLDPTIRVWHSAFARYGIPLSAYEELYQRAFDVRQTKMQQGDLNKVPPLDATLLVSQWDGPHGLKAELKQRDIDSGKFLPDNAESICQDCFGSGFYQMNRADGTTGVIKCEHRGLRPPTA